MATQIIDTEKDVCLKWLHFSQRELYFERFVHLFQSDYAISCCLKSVKYWRARYNAACAVEQAREEEVCLRCKGDHSWCQSVRDDEYA